MEIYIYEILPHVRVKRRLPSHGIVLVDDKDPPQATDTSKPINDLPQRMRFIRVSPLMINANDTDCVHVRRSQVLPVTVTQSRLVRVALVCGTIVSTNNFTTVAEIYQLVRSRLVRLQGPSWCRNHFRVEVSYRSRLLMDRNVDLIEYGIRDGDRIQVTVTGHLLGGTPSGVTVRGEYFPHIEDTWCARKKLRTRQLITFTRMSHEYLPTDRMRKTTKKKVRSLEERAFDQFEVARMEVQASGDYLSMAQSFLTSLDNQFDTDFF